MNDETKLYFIIIGAVVLSLIILYFIIKGAVRSANAPLLRQLRILTYMVHHQAKPTPEQARDILEKVNHIDDVARWSSESDRETELKKYFV